MLTVLHLDDGEPEPAEYLVAGLIPKVGIGLVVAAEGAGKSMLLAELSAEIAGGGVWAGRTLKPGSVLYVAPERGAVTRRRLHAIAGDDARIAIASGPFDLRSPTAVTELREAARKVEARAGIRLGLLVIDTLSAATPGIRENETSDLARIGTALGHLSEELRAPIVIVHHVRKSDGQARGSSALPAAADAVLRVVADKSGRRVIVPEKLSDGPLAPPVRFTIREVAGAPRVIWGDTILKPTEEAERLPRSAVVALEALSEMLGTVPDRSEGVPFDEWRAETIRRLGKDNPKTARSAFFKAKTALFSAERIAELPTGNVTVPERSRTVPAKTESVPDVPSPFRGGNAGTSAIKGGAPADADEWWDDEFDGFEPDLPAGLDEAPEALPF
jgi:hypothetical protein